MQLTGVISGTNIDLGAFKKPKIAVALEVADLYFIGESVKVRAQPRERPSWSPHCGAAASAHRSKQRQTVAEDDWYEATFNPSVSGAYRVSVSGGDVEEAEDAFAVVEARVTS